MNQSFFAIPEGRSPEGISKKGLVLHNLVHVYMKKRKKLKKLRKIAFLAFLGGGFHNFFFAGVHSNPYGHITKKMFYGVI